MFVEYDIICRKETERRALCALGPCRIERGKGAHMELQDINLYRENDQLEAKAAQLNLPRSLWETYSSFANTSGGLILLGVEERGRQLHVIGVPNPDKLLEDFWNAVNNPKKVSSNILSERNVRILFLDDKAVIGITVPRADRHIRPVFIDNNPLTGTYRRNHSGDYRCSYETIRSMMRDAADESQDLRVVERLTISDLDHDTVRRYRNRYNQFNEDHVWSSLPDDEFLIRIGAACQVESDIVRPTVAGLLMFGEDWRIMPEMPQYFLDYREQGDPTLRWEDRITSQTGDWSGNVYDFYFRIYQKLAQALKVPFKLEGISRIDDTPAHKALREALVNCLTNADYHGRRGLVALRTPDRIELANPGGFRVDMKAALSGGVSDPRNATMAKIFSFVEIGERAGSGLPKILAGWKACGLPEPTITESFDPDQTIMSLPLVETENRPKKPAEKTGRKNRPKKSAGKTGKITEAKEQQIVTLLIEMGPLRRGKILEELGLGATRTKELLSGMVSKGLIVPEGSGRARVYRLPDDKS